MITSQPSKAGTDPTGTPEPSPRIMTEKLCKQFHDRLVLEDFDLQVSAGETICVIGPSGSGKSTMLRCLNGLELATSGEVLIEGVRLPKRQQDLDQVRRRLGMVFQHFNLFPHLSVASNVAFGLRHSLGTPKQEALNRAHDELAKVGLEHLAGGRPAQLSGGEQQRVAIARALAMDPAALLFDEPTSALDPELVKDVLTLMADLSRQDMTMVVVTHEMRFARRAANRVLFMDCGRLVESGTPEELFENPQSERLKKFLSQVN